MKSVFYNAGLVDVCGIHFRRNAPGRRKKTDQLQEISGSKRDYRIPFKSRDGLGFWSRTLNAQSSAERFQKPLGKTVVFASEVSVPPFPGSPKKIRQGPRLLHEILIERKHPDVCGDPKPMEAAQQKKLVDFSTSFVRY